MRTNKTLFASLALALAAFAGTASADDVTEDMNVDVSIYNQCQLSTLDFTGVDYGSLSTVTQGFHNQGVTVKCNKGTAYTVSPGDGMSYGQAVGHPNKRALSDGAGNFIPYEMFRDPGSSQAWGTGADVIEGVGNGDNQGYLVAFTFYDLNLAPAGLYADTFEVTLTY